MDLSGPFIRGQGYSPDRPTRLADGLGLKVPWFDSANLRPGAVVRGPIGSPVPAFIRRGTRLHVSTIITSDAR